MSVHENRRDAKAQRIPFEAIVEIGGEVDPSAAFEAQGVNLSATGMQLRTAYLPDIGQPASLPLRQRRPRDCSRGRRRLAARRRAGRRVRHPLHQPGRGQRCRALGHVRRQPRRAERRCGQSRPIPNRIPAPAFASTSTASDRP